MKKRQRLFVICVLVTIIGVSYLMGAMEDAYGKVGAFVAIVVTILSAFMGRLSKDVK